jgi:hypothetical protein
MGPSGVVERAWTRARAPFLRTLPSWLVARALVVGALALAHYLVDHLHVHDAIVEATTRAGLTSWDGAYYVDIAKHGYEAIPRDSVRFFPLIPMLARPFIWVGIPAQAAVVIVANVSALIAGVLLFLLVRRETHNAEMATRAVWFLALAPAAFVLVMGYTEATTIALAIGMFLALRNRWWWTAAAIGVLAGLSRPAGVVLAVPALVEAGRGFSGLPVKEYAARTAAVVSTGVGTLLYLIYVGAQFGDMWLPYSIQTESSRRGSFANPVDTVSDALHGLFNGNAVGTGLHVPWLLVALALVVVCFLQWPLSYGLYATASIGTAIVSTNLDSFERYALVAFPLVMVVARLTPTKQVERGVLVLSGAAMTIYALLAFLHAYVP